MAERTGVAALLFFQLGALAAGIDCELERQLEQLYRHHAQDLRAFIIHLGVAPAEAEDLLINAFLGTYRAMQRKGALQEPRAYLYAVASNKVRGHWRQHYERQARVDRVQQLEEADARIDSLDETTRIDDQLACQDVLAGLPRRQREAFVLRHYAGFPPEEIATVMGIEATAVKTHLQRARQKLSHLQHEGREAAS